MRCWRVRRRRGDEGAVLIIALIIVTVVALVTGLVLTRGDGSLRATVALRNVAASSYAADGAAQIVLNDLRTGFWDTSDDQAGNDVPPDWVFTNAVGDSCFGDDVTDDDDITSADDDLVLSSFFPAGKSSGDAPASAYVHCRPEKATGEQGTVRVVSDANSPGDAIITLGSGGEDGLYNFNKVLKVRGGIRSNSTINANKDIQVDDADVRSRNGSCTNVAVSVGYTCATDGGVDAGLFDVAKYDADISSIAEVSWQPVPACTGAFVAFAPGYYDDAAALEALNSCNKPLWFKPGTYYFDFHNDDNGDPLFEAGIAGDTDNEWLIEGRKVIGGALKPGLTLDNSTPVPGACQNPIEDVTAQGVQFVLGGDSRINVGSDSLVELCADYRADQPPMVVYGPRATDADFGGNPTLTQLTGSTNGSTTTADAAVTAPGSHGTFVGGTRAALQDAGNGSAVWSRTTSTGGAQTRTLTMTGFPPSQAVPRGAVLTQARAIVRHRNGGTATNAATLRIVPAAAGAPALDPVVLGRPASLTDETVDLKTALSAAQWSRFAKGVHDHGYTGATVEYAATLPTGSAGSPRVAEVDLVRLELEYYVPRLRGTSAIPTNCVTTIGASGCFQLDTHKKSEVYLQGTTFLPQGRIDLEVANTDHQVFRWGVIARSIQANLNGAYKEDGALIELPDNSPGLGLNGTIVQFDVHLCPDAPTCDASGRLALKVRAQIWDVDGDATTTGDREVTVMSWSHQR